MEERERGEPIPRHFLIGILGPIGAGKTTLSRTLVEGWQARQVAVKHLQEEYPENPHLANFYKDPPRHSLKSQLFFLHSKIEQLALTVGRGTLRESSYVVDPAKQMDWIYARTHYEMGWMRTDEFELYQGMYQALGKEKKVPLPDIFIVVTAPVNVLLQRIRKREGERPFERGLLQYPWGEEYLTKLSEMVERWYNQKLGEPSHPPIARIDSGTVNFSFDQDGREHLLEDIGHWIRYYFVDHPEYRTDSSPLIIPEAVLSYPRP